MRHTLIIGANKPPRPRSPASRNATRAPGQGNPPSAAHEERGQSHQFVKARACQIVTNSSPTRHKLVTNAPAPHNCHPVYVAPGCFAHPGGGSEGRRVQGQGQAPYGRALVHKEKWCLSGGARAAARPQNGPAAPPNRPIWPRDCPEAERGRSNAQARLRVGEGSVRKPNLIAENARPSPE